MSDKENIPSANLANLAEASEFAAPKSKTFMVSQSDPRTDQPSKMAEGIKAECDRMMEADSEEYRLKRWGTKTRKALSIQSDHLTI